MSTIGGVTASYGDELIDVDTGADDDIDIVLVDDDEGQPAPLRGQNEGDDHADPAAADYDDPRFQERLSQERRRAEAIERNALEQQERTEQALLAAEKRNIAVQRDSFRLALDGVDVRIRTTTEALKMARTDGDVGAETDLEQQLSELRRIRGQIDDNMGRLPDEKRLDQEFQQHIENRRSQYAARQTQDDTPRPLNERAGKWQKLNGWMSDTTKTKERAALMEINAALVAEGYDANGDDFFSEMSRRLAKRFPSLGVKSLNGSGVGDAPRQTQQRQAPPVGTGRTAAPPSPVGQKQRQRVQLDSSDIKMMRMFRIDPNDKAAVQRYAAEKLKRVASEQNMQRR